MLFALESAGGVLIPVNKNLQNNFVDEGKYDIIRPIIKLRILRKTGVLMLSHLKSIINNGEGMW